MMTALTTIIGMIPLTFARPNDMGLSYKSFGLTLIGGMTTATLAATDGIAEVQQVVEIMIRNLNRPPTLSAPDTVSVAEGDPVAFTASARSDDDTVISPASPLATPTARRWPRSRSRITRQDG